MFRLLCIEKHDYFLSLRCAHRESTVVGDDGKSTSPTIDQNGEFNLRWPAMIEKFVERGLYGPARIQNIINQDDRRTAHISGYVGRRKFLRDRIAPYIVTVERDIHCPELNGDAGCDGGKTGSKSPCNFNSAVRNAQDQELAR